VAWVGFFYPLPIRATSSHESQSPIQPKRRNDLRNKKCSQRLSRSIPWEKTLGSPAILSGKKERPGNFRGALTQAVGREAIRRKCPRKSYDLGEDPERKDKFSQLIRKRFIQGVDLFPELRVAALLHKEKEEAALLNKNTKGESFE